MPGVAFSVGTMTDQTVNFFAPTQLAPAVLPGGPVRSSGDAETRVRVIEATIAVLRRYAFHQASFDLVAATAHLPVTDVAQVFPTWDALLVATLDRWNGQRMRPIRPVAERHGAAVFLRTLVQANIADPALMRVLSATVNIAATPGHPMASHLHHAWHDFHVFVMNQLAADISAGREPDTMQPARGAEQLIALYEGLQLQSMVRPGMDLLDSYDRAVTRLRDGWSHTYTPPVWGLDNS
jgi:AcrR family transcriptional regulator